MQIPRPRTALPAAAALAALGLSFGSPLAQQHGEHASPYADQSASGIAALSAEEMADLLAGEGMGLARAAELNAYPGPKHVLDLALEMELDEPTVAAVREVRAAMLAQARALGERIVEAERQLDARFVSETIQSTELAERVTAIGRLRGELRTVHLEAHLRTRALLTAAQVHEYQRLRGTMQHGDHEHR